jgi:hypothetical protein
MQRIEVPADLERAVHDTEGWVSLPEHVAAPEVLDRLVQEELADLPKSIVRRVAGRLERLRAPRILRTRVERARAARNEPRRLRPYSKALLAAGFLAVIVAAGLLFDQRRSDAPVTYDFVVERVKPSELRGRHMQGLLAGVTGGWTDVALRKGENP